MRGRIPSKERVGVQGKVLPPKMGGLQTFWGKGVGPDPLDPFHRFAYAIAVCTHIQNHYINVYYILIIQYHIYTWIVTQCETRDNLLTSSHSDIY